MCVSTLQNCAPTAQPVTLWVTDSCPTCAPNQLNLHALAFQNNFNNDLSVGRVNITFEQVRPPHMPMNSVLYEHSIYGL